MTIDELLTNYRGEEISERDKGAKFERLMKNFLLTRPEYRGKFSDVWLWNEFPFREEFGTIDLGIDLVAKTADDEFWAVQCKFYFDTTPINKSAVDTFLATSSKIFAGDKKFSGRLWISTSDNLTDNAEITLQNQSPEVNRIGMEELRKAAVDWEKLDAGIFGEEALKNFRKPREHQLKAIDAAKNHFATHDRGKLIMSCGSGKTYTSLRIAETLAPDGKILFLVPSISLLSQILYEWATFAAKPFNYICVCSDETVFKKTEDEIKSVNLPLPPTTDAEKISRRMKNFSRDAMTVIFSTYQSLEKVSEAQKIFDADFDLIICDEAHRTTGSSKDPSTQFTAVHDQNFIRGKKRLYMTATPRLYTSDAKKKAEVKDITLWSMDDENIFGEEFFHLGFGEAVESQLLSDYKVIVLTLNKTSDEKNSAADDLAKINGCINALSKKMINVSQVLAEIDPAPMKTAVAFCPKISDSKVIADMFNAAGTNEKNFLRVEAAHVDGTQPSKIREGHLRWLKDTPAAGNECRILTNVRCLSEGIDVPALDAVIFMSSKKSKVEIVQAVGRVMRKADDKKYGYIIIPVVVPLEKNPEEVLAASDTYKVIWDVLNAMRAHDSRMDIFIQEVKLKLARGKKPDGGRVLISTDEENFQTSLNFGEWEDFLYARMVERVGNRRYWEQWAKDIAQIAERHISQIKKLTAADGKYYSAFNAFVGNLQQNTNHSITSDAAIEMLAHHLIARPVFDAIFEGYSFVKSNPISQSLEKILAELKIEDSAEDSARLKKFYDSVRERCRIATTPVDKQNIIIELYDKFFRMAMPKTVERLGIVYTPVEVVDFILRSVDAVLKKNFRRTLSDKNVHVLDPFTGTGTFLTRLIQSGLIKPKDLERKYQTELHANELVLLAYYIAAVNVENSFHSAFCRQIGQEGVEELENSIDLTNYFPFKGICFTDTFQAFERDEEVKGQMTIEGTRDPAQENSARVNKQNRTRIEIIVGNPPYSVGQRSANDNNQNDFYPKLEGRIAATYAAKTDATNKNSLYDSYIKAFRWASDRVDEGIIGFVTNAGWLDGAAMDGLRKSFAEEFAEIYVFNLRGNARTQGELRRREKDNVFGQGSRAPIAVTILVKRAHEGSAKIFYKDIGDYLSRDEKFFEIKRVGSVLSDEFKPLTPNERGDWINQRGEIFDTFIPLTPDKKFDGKAESFFVTYSNGLKTQRDNWCYNFSKPTLQENMRRTIDAFNFADERNFYLTKEIVWTRATKQGKIQGKTLIYSIQKVVDAFYRPFCQEKLYYDADLIEMTYQIKKFFPDGCEENLLINVSASSSSKNFSVLMTNKITDLHFNGDTQCFPLHWYEQATQENLFGEKFERRDGVSDWILRRAYELYGSIVKKEDIFYYVYGFLHLPAYREKFSSELKKSLPRIFLVDAAEKFWSLSRAGRRLAEIHLNYEKQPAPDGVQVIGGENFRVKKMRLSKDRTTLIYNEDIKIKNIPPKSFEYVVNGRSPLEWVIERYQWKEDKPSKIVNDPNAWAIEHGDEKYILNLVLSSITVSLKTLEIVEDLPTIKF